MRLKFILAACAVLAFLAAPALADLSGTIHARFDYVAGENVHIWGAGANGEYVRSGVYMFTKLSATGDGAYIPGPTFPTFCADVRDRITGGQVETWDVVELTEIPDNTQPHMSATQASRIRELWGEHFASLTSDAQRNAMQLAVWEIINENVTQVSDYNVLSGTFYSDASGYVAGLANGWLNTLDGNGWAWLAGMREAPHCDYQDFITGLVPAPGAALLGVIGLGLVGWVKRRLS